jgi:hypothetical protein
MRRARVDISQAPIVKTLRQIGASVEPRLSRIGQGVPDLLVGWRGVNVLLETKTGERDCDRKLTGHEQAWHEKWAGQVAIVSTPDEAVNAVLKAARQA